MTTEKQTTMTKKTPKQTRKNKEWLNNPDCTKTPKVFQVTMMRDKNGFHMLGGESRVLTRVNQHKSEWTKVDTRDLASVLRNSKINTF